MRLNNWLKVGFHGVSDVKESACNTRDPGLIPGSGRLPGEGNGYPLQYSYLENPMDCIVHGVTRNQMFDKIGLGSCEVLDFCLLGGF